MPPQILHFDNHLLVVAKPAGVPIVPDESGDPSLLDWGKAWVKREYQKPGRVYLGVVHRLDRPVSGVVLFARTSKAAARLARAFRERDVTKIYWGISRAVPDPAEGTVEHWLVKDRRRNTVRVVRRQTEEAKLAETRWRVLEQRGKGRDRRVLVELMPRTGRPHQLRVAMAGLGAPLSGDLKYGAEAPLPDRSIALHAHSLEVAHPTRPERMCFRAPPPQTEIWKGFEL